MNKNKIKTNAGSRERIGWEKQSMFILKIRPAIENVNISLQGDSRSPSAAHGRKKEMRGVDQRQIHKCFWSRAVSLIEIAFWRGVNNSIIKYSVWHLLYRRLQIVFLSLSFPFSLSATDVWARVHAHTRTRSVCVRSSKDHKSLHIDPVNLPPKNSHFHMLPVWGCYIWAVHPLSSRSVFCLTFEFISLL